MLSGLPSMFGTTTFPVITCGYTATQYRSAYGANMTNTGTGQTIAFAEAGGLVPDMFKTLQDFAEQYHLPAPAAARYQEINQQPASCTTPQESHRRRADGRGVGLRHGTGGQPARGRRQPV